MMITKMQMNISRQQPQNIKHNQCLRWQRHAQCYDKLSTRLANRSARLATARLITFIALVTVLVSPADRDLYFGVFAELVIALLGAAFITLVYTHKRVNTRKLGFEHLAHYHQQAIKRRKRDWQSLPSPADFPEPQQTSFKDLAITGEQANLKTLFGMMFSAEAWQTWYAWLKTPIDDKALRARQASVRELMTKRTSLLRFLHACAQCKLGDKVRHELVSWLGSKQTDAPITLVFFISLLSVSCFWVGLIGYLYKVMPLWLCASALLVNGLLTLISFTQTDQLFNRADGLNPVLASMQKRIAALNKSHFDDPRLVALHRPLAVTDKHSLRLIQTLSMLAELRHFGIFFLLAQLILVWNVFIYQGILVWHRNHSKQVLTSYQSLTELETLISIACFARENSEFSFAEQQDTAQVIKVSNIAHPLLSYQARIANHLHWTQDKPMLLISGSNMAGKSTFIKALGCNVLLSRLGAPICAESAYWPSLHLKTVIKVEDSLAEGDSYFMSELKRLVTATQTGQGPEQAETQASHPVFNLCLFDEIMSGTNSHDRTEIFKAIVRRLKQQNTFAIFSTHDMKLADYAANDEKFALYQFNEAYSQERDQVLMHFDYKLKPGRCYQTNAQTLLKVLGLEPS